MKRKGFTLIEVMIVLVMICLSISLVIPSLSRFSQTLELRAAARKVSGILRYCRNEAVQKGKVQQVFFHPASREIEVLALETAANEYAPAVDLSATKRYVLPSGVRIREWRTLEADSWALIEFYPNGGSSGGWIVLDRPDLKGYRIQVDILTGLVGIAVP